MTNLALDLREAAQMYPDRPAVRLDDTIISYALLDELSARVAGWLRARGLRPGDPVGIMLPNVPQFPVCYFGVLRAGGAVVPMNPLLKSREVTHHLGDSGARLVIAWETAASEAQAGAEAAGASAVIIDGSSLDSASEWPLSPEVARRADDDTAVILYTSGTTGTPKGAELTHANLRRNASVTATTLLAPRPGRRGDGLPAAVPQLRPDLRAERRGAVRRLPDADPAVQRGAGAAGDRAGPGHRVRGRADHVRRPARTRPRARRTRPRCGCASPAAPRCPSRCCTGSRRRSAR